MTAAATPLACQHGPSSPHCVHVSPACCFALQAESLQAQVEDLAAEKAAQFEARMQAETRLANLEAELSSACSELESAKHTGTPKGEGSCQ